MATDIKDSLSRQIAKINIKATSFIEENKIKIYLDSLQKEVRELQEKCGEQAYQMWVGQEFHMEKLTPIFQSISDKYIEIQQQNEVLEELQQKNRQMLGEREASINSPKLCPQCGAPCTIDMNFCRGCGAKLHE